MEGGRNTPYLFEFQYQLANKCYKMYFALSK